MSEIIKKSNFIVLPNETDPIQQKHEAWQKLRDAGMSVKQIAELFHVHYLTVVKHTHKGADVRAAVLHAQYEERRGYYVPLMLELRKRGYGNMEIAKVTGFSVGTVYKYIGTQPDEVSLASRRIAGAKHHFRSIARKNQPARDEGKPIPAVSKILETA